MHCERMTSQGETPSFAVLWSMQHRHRPCCRAASVLPPWNRIRRREESWARSVRYRLPTALSKRRLEGTILQVEKWHKLWLGSDVSWSYKWRIVQRVFSVFDAGDGRWGRELRATRLSHRPPAGSGCQSCLLYVGLFLSHHLLCD